MKRWQMMVGLLLVLLTSCGGAGGGATGGTAYPAAPGAAASPASGTATDAMEQPAAEAAGESAEGGAAAPAEETSPDQAVRFQQQPSERMVIRTATQQLLVEDVDDAEAQVRQIAAARGGYVLSAESSGEAEERYATITIRVPADRFDETLTALADLATKVEAQRVEGKDVTDEFVDLEARLRNLRAVEARLLQFLEQATTVEDSLRVSNELSKTQGEIEQIQGRINYLEQSTAFSTITVTLRGEPAVAVTTQTGWSPVATARASLQSLIQFGQAVLTLLIVVAIWLPVWGPLVFGGVWLWRRSHRVPVTPA